MIIKKQLWTKALLLMIMMTSIVVADQPVHCKIMIKDYDF
jgi:hypothetical protein